MHAQLDFVRASLRYSAQLVIRRKRWADNSLPATTWPAASSDVRHQDGTVGGYVAFTQYFGCLDDQTTELNGNLDEIAYHVILERQAEADIIKSIVDEDEPELCDSQGTEESSLGDAPSPESKVTKEGLDIAIKDMNKEIASSSEVAGTPEPELELTAPCPPSVTCSPS